MEIKDVWDFIEAYRRNYYGCDMIAHIDDLEKIINNEDEEGSCARETLTTKYKGNRASEQIKNDLHYMTMRVYEEAIEGYIESLNTSHP